MRSLVLFLCFVALRQAHCVPSTRQPSCGTELVRVAQGDTLYLPCGSYCSESSSRESTYTWWRVSGERGGKREQLSFTGASVTEDQVTGESGGEYECQCGSSGEICTFYVAILPKVTFTSSHSASHYGNVVTLTCVVEGYPANYSIMTNAYGIAVQNYFKKKISNSRIETLAVVRDIEEEDYVCLVQTHYKGYPIAEEKHTLKIHLYNPPSILYTTEYVVHQEADFGKPGQLSCAVETSTDSQSHVTWWAGGEQLKEGDKYQMSSSAMSDQVTVFKLHMEAVQQSDIGPYLCQLSSDYDVEESQEAWIKVDYRKEATHIGGSLYTDNAAAAADRESPAHSLHHKSTSSLRTVAVVLCLVLVAGLGTWGAVLRRRKWRKRGSEKDGIIGNEVDHGSTRGSPVHYIGPQQSVVRRK